MKSFSRRVSAIALLLCARTMFADPITGLTGWIHRSMTQAGSDIVPVLVIIGALIGMARGWMGVLAGAALGFVIAIIVANADAIAVWGHSISLS